MGDNFSAIFAGLACLISTYAVWIAHRTDKTKNTLDIWSVWISKEYREYRVTSHRAIEQLRLNRSGNDEMNYDLLIKDHNIEEAIGSIEHFVDETSKLMSRGLLDRNLFNALFMRSMTDWRGLLRGFSREPHKSFSNDELEAAFRVLVGDQPLGQSRFDLLSEQ